MKMGRDCCFLFPLWCGMVVQYSTLFSPSLSLSLRGAIQPTQEEKEEGIAREEVSILPCSSLSPGCLDYSGDLLIFLSKKALN